MPEKQADTKPTTATTQPAIADAALPVKHAFSELPTEIDHREDPSDYLAVDSALHNVLYLVLDDEYERAAAEHWMAKNAPDVPYDNLRTDLPLELDRRSVVFILARKGTRRQPTKPALRSLGRNPEGFFVHERVDAKELAEDFGAYGGTKERPGIRVQDYWRRGSTRFTSGVDWAALKDEIQKYAIPYVVRFFDPSSTKNDSRNPTKLYLTSV